MSEYENINHTVGIQIPDKFFNQKVKICMIIKWANFQTPFKYGTTLTRLHMLVDLNTIHSGPVFEPSLKNQIKN